MKKKILCSMLIAVTAISIVGCGSSKTASTKEKVDKAAEEIVEDAEDVIDETVDDGQIEDEKLKEIDFSVIEGKYTPEKIAEITGTKSEFTENNIFEDANIQCYSDLHTYIDSKFEGINYYLFNNADDARTVFDGFVNNSFDEDDLVVEDNYVNGWQKGVMDADIKLFIYIDDNLIIMYDDCILGCELALDSDGNPIETNESDTNSWEEEAAEMHELIMSTFN